LQQLSRQIGIGIGQQKHAGPPSWNHDLSHFNLTPQGSLPSLKLTAKAPGNKVKPKIEITSSNHQFSWASC